MKKRIAKFLAEGGIASRRKCEALIEAGRVKLNGEIVSQLGTQIDPEIDVITVDGQEVEGEKKVYFLLNKPPGYLCSNVGKKRVVDLFQGLPYRLFTVGRLDKDTTGLLLVTNDGEYANRVIHPSSGIQKEYIAKTADEILPSHIAKIKKGTRVEGVFVRPAKVEKMRRGTVKIVVNEGKKREVRILVKEAGLSLLELSRTRIGNLRLGKLPLGEWRELRPDEAEKIFT